MTADPFDTGRLRAAVLEAWAASPTRFREDANTEEDHARGGYRDRVVVELAQNAADAAVRDGIPGHLLLTLVDDPDGALLVAANTGAPLDADGVASLASLRASAKRATDSGGTSVGRFGVGFAAVRSVADDVAVVSRTGSVHFSSARTAELLTTLPALAGRVADRSGVLPALRLPFAGPGPLGIATPVTPGDPSPPAPRNGRRSASQRQPAPIPSAEGSGSGSWATVVVLRLRDEAAIAAVRAQLEAVDDALLLALPALVAVAVEIAPSTAGPHHGIRPDLAPHPGTGRAIAPLTDAPHRRTLRDVHDRWVVARRSGAVPADVLEDRPVEERTRRTWSVTWAAPRPGTSPDPRVVHAPTPTDEPSTVPALLVATFPLDPSRRHVPPGALTDLVVARAGETWRDLVLACVGADGSDVAATSHGASSTERDASRTAAPHPLDLVPSGLPGGVLDAAVRDAVVAAMREVPFLRPIGGGPAIAPLDATVLAGPAGDDDALLAVLGSRVATLVRAAPQHRTALRVLGAEQVELADVVDALPDLTPTEHRALLDAVPSALLEALATVPVPLADGRTVRGARGAVVLDAPDDVVAALSTWGLRVIHPDAAHPLHERLGAQALDVDGMLRHPVLRARVLDAEEVEDDVVAVVLGLLVRADPGTLERPEPWWAELLLPADDGAPAPARGLVLPGSRAARWFDPDVLAPLADDVAAAWDADVLAAAGVRADLPVVHVAARESERAVGPDTDLGNDTELGTDADLVTDALDGWREYVDAVGDPAEQVVVGDLDALREDAWPEVLDALATRAPTALRPGPGGRPSYVTWWLRERSGTGVGRPFALPVAAPSAGAVPVDPVGDARPLLPAVPAVVRGLEVPTLRLLGGVDDVADLDLAGWLTVLGDPGAQDAVVPLPAAAALWSLLVRAAGGSGTPPLADALARTPLPAWDGERAVVADDVAVGPPGWAQHPGVGPVLVVPAEAADDVADLLDTDLAEELAEGRVTSRGRRREVPEAARRTWPDLPATWWQHARLEVDGTPLRPLPGAEVWWVDAERDVHATGRLGLASGLAAATDWSRRYVLEVVLTDPARLSAAVIEGAGESAAPCGPGPDRRAWPHA